MTSKGSESAEVTRGVMADGPAPSLAKLLEKAVGSSSSDDEAVHDIRVFAAAFEERAARVLAIADSEACTASAPPVDQDAVGWFGREVSSPLEAITIQVKCLTRRMTQFMIIFGAVIVGLTVWNVYVWNGTFTKLDTVAETSVTSLVDMEKMQVALDNVQAGQHRVQADMKSVLAGMERNLADMKSVLAALDRVKATMDKKLDTAEGQLAPLERQPSTVKEVHSFVSGLRDSVDRMPRVAGMDLEGSPGKKDSGGAFIHGRSLPADAGEDGSSPKIDACPRAPREWGAQDRHSRRDRLGETGVQGGPRNRIGSGKAGNILRLFHSRREFRMFRKCRV